MAQNFVYLVPCSMSAGQECIQSCGWMQYSINVNCINLLISYVFTDFLPARSSVAERDLLKSPIAKMGLSSFLALTLVFCLMHFDTVVGYTCSQDCYVVLENYHPCHNGMSLFLIIFLVLICAQSEINVAIPSFLLKA